MKRILFAISIFSMGLACAGDDASLLDSFKKPPRVLPQNTIKHGDVLRIVNKMWNKPLTYVTWNECTRHGSHNECDESKSMWIIGLGKKPDGKAWSDDDSEYAAFNTNAGSTVSWTIDRGELGAGELKFGDVIALVVNGHYLTGDLGDFITRLSTKKDVWEKFIVVSPEDKTGLVGRGDSVAFQTFKNDNKNNPRYLTISDSGKAVVDIAGAKGKKISLRQIFTITK